MQRTKKTIVLGSAAAIAFGAASSFLFPLYGTALGALVVPFIVALTLCAGGFCGGLATALLALVAGVRAGWAGATLVLLTVPGTSAMIALLLSRKAQVHHATYYSAAAMMIGMVAFWAVYALATGSDLGSDLTETMRDAMLGLAPQWDFPQEVAAEWEKQIVALFDVASEALKGLLLPQMALVACLSALLGSTLPIVWMRKRALAESVSTLSLLHTWRIPRKVALALMGTYVAAYLFSWFGVPGMFEVSQSAWSAIEVVYGAACLSLVSLLLRRAALSRGVRNLVLALCTLAIAVMQLFGFLGAIPFVLVGVLGDAYKGRLARMPGDLYGPFGPPDEPPRLEGGEDG